MAEQTLEELIAGLSPEKIASLRSLLGDTKTTRTKKSTPSSGPVTTYISVEIHIRCRHCGTLRVVTHKCEKKEVVHTLNTTNQVIHTVVDKPCVLDNYTRCCPACPDYIKGLDRGVLEYKYLELLRKV